MAQLIFAALLFSLAAFSQKPDPALQSAIAAHQSGNLDAAVAGYREYLKKDPNNVGILTNLGAALSRQGRYADAIQVYRAGLKLAPANAGLALNLALAHYKMGDIASAAKELTTLRALAPDNEQATLLLADCWLQMGQNQKVIDLLTPAQKANPQQLGIAYMLGTALMREKRDDEGQRVLEPIFRRGDSAEARLLFGTAKMNNADFPGAVADLQKAAELNPKLPAVHAYLGRALSETGDSDGAAKAFRQELAIDPNNFMANLNLAVIHKLNKDFDSALRLLDAAIRVRPGDPGVRFQYGAIYVSQGRFEEARKVFEELVKENPQFTEAHVNLATIYYRLKRKEDGDRERAIVQKLNAEAQAREAKKPGEVENRTP
jgi:Flp pilus assembly protein TadD